MFRSARALPVLGRALLVSALAAPACDGALIEVPHEDSPASPEVSSKIDPRVGLDRHADRSREVIVLLDDRSLRATFLSPIVADDPGRIEAMAAGLDAAKDRILAGMTRHRLVALDRYSHLPALHLVLDSDEALAELAADPGVARIVANDTVQLAETVPANLALIRQPQAAAAGKLGEGATVAVLDTGTDWKRAPFNCTAAGPGCKVVYAGDFAPEDNAPDANGHGTNVAGIVLAVAPGAQIAALDVFNGDSGWTSDILKAINWTIQNKAKYNIVALNLSLGGGSFTSACPTDPLAIAVESAKIAGILSAVASGNGGTANAVSSPACAPSAISVGAVHAANLGGLRWPVCADVTTAADKVACFSNSIPFLTLLAPGVMINAAGMTMTGTSQATPHVAGAVAVLRSAFPSETPDAIVKRMTSTGVAVTDARNGVATPRLDLFAALGAPAEKPAATTPGPRGKLVLSGGVKYTRTLTISASVATTSGAATQVCLSATGSCTEWVAWAPTVSFTLPAGDGTKLVSAWWKDAKGNASAVPATAAIVLDTTAPVGGTLGLKLSSTQATFAWSGMSDRGAGIASYKLMVAATPIAAGCPGAAAYEGKNTNALVKGLAAKKTYYVRLCATDNIGNASAGFGGPFVTPAK